MASRRTTSDSNDEQYKVALKEPFSTLSREGRQGVVALIPEESRRPLAERLLLGGEIIAALNRQDIQYPASEIVEAWSRKKCSTIWILRDALDSLGLEDALAELEKARFDYVTIYAVINGDPRRFNDVPGRKPLKEIIRPYIYRQQGRNMTQSTIQVLRLTRIGDSEHELTWSSPAMLFKAQQIDINSEQRKLDAVQRHTDQAGKLQDRVRVERNVISWIDNDSLYFEYDEDGNSSTQPDLGLGKAVQEESKEEERLGDGMAELSLSSSTEKPIFGETKKRISSRKERTVANPTSTSCQFVEISNEDTLREHLIDEGDFVVQQIQTEGCKTLRLNVLHGDRILQYPITEHCADGEEDQFSISDAEHAATGVQQLLDYYQVDGHHLPHLPSLPPVQVEDDFVYLKRNRFLSLNHSDSSS